jgi:hypothetical protein
MGDSKGEKNMPLKYHSILKDELPIEQELESYQAGGSRVFRYDIVNDRPVPEIFKKAQVIYSEPAWPYKYDVLCKRAGLKKDEIDYADYLENIWTLIHGLGVPAYIIASSKMMKILLDPELIVPVKLNGAEAKLCIWNIPYDDFIFIENNSKNTDIIKYVVGKYNTILDFSCGYGNIVRPALDVGKKFICSDFNAKCVYYIASEFMGYHGVI